ncbi:unnamed protein product [Caenorhabditis brenneri]
MAKRSRKSTPRAQTPQAKPFPQQQVNRMLANFGEFKKKYRKGTWRFGHKELYEYFTTNRPKLILNLCERQISFSQPDTNGIFWEVPMFKELLEKIYKSGYKLPVPAKVYNEGDEGGFCRKCKAVHPEGYLNALVRRSEEAMYLQDGVLHS